VGETYQFQQAERLVAMDFAESESAMPSTNMCQKRTCYIRQYLT
jgi:hypothetical protein